MKPQELAVELAPQDEDATDEDCVVVSSTVRNALVDYPHARHDCLVFRFGETANSQHCTKASPITTLSLTVILTIDD